MSKPYRLKYQITPGHWTKSDLDHQDGACDKALLISVIKNQDGSGSYLPIGIDPDQENNEMSASDLWRCWTILTGYLAEDKRLDPLGGRRMLCEMVINHIRDTLAKMSPEADKP